MDADFDRFLNPLTKAGQERMNQGFYRQGLPDKSGIWSEYGILVRKPERPWLVNLWSPEVF